MMYQACDELGRFRLAWPEPLILETIRAAYGPTAGSSETLEAAQLHMRFLRALIDGKTDRAGPLRVALIAGCAARRIGPEAIADADHAAFRELTAIVQARFRNSPRLLRLFAEQLHDALGVLTTRKAPAKPPGARLRDRLWRASGPADRALALTD